MLLLKPARALRVLFCANSNSTMVEQGNNYKERLQRLCRDAELGRGEIEISYNSILESNDQPVNPPAGPVSNAESLAADYKLAATLLRAAKLSGQDFLARFCETQLRLMKQLHFLYHKRELDGNIHGTVSPEDVVQIIDILKWAVVTNSSSQPTSMPAEVSISNISNFSNLRGSATVISRDLANTTVATVEGSTSNSNIRRCATVATGDVTNTTAATATVSVPNTGTFPTKVSKITPTKPTSRKMVHYKTRTCPLCKKTQKQLARHLQTHVRKGEIAMHHIQALVQYADKGAATHRQEQFVGKNKKVARYRRRYFRCPMCEFATAYLSTHLARQHKIKRGSEEMYRMKQLAKPYEGRKELEHIMQSAPRKPQPLPKRKKAEEDETLAKFLSKVRGASEGEEEDQEESSDESYRETYSKRGSDNSSVEDLEYSEVDVPDSPELFPPTPQGQQLKLLRQRAEEAAVRITSDQSLVGKEGQTSSNHGDDDRDQIFNNDTEDENEEHYDQSEEEDDDENEDDLENDPDADIKRSLVDELKERQHTEEPAKWFLAFFEYLQSLDGKVLSEKNAKQHTRQVMILFDAADPSSDSLEQLPAEKGKRIWAYVKPLLDSKEKRPGTMVAYLTSIQKFFEFVVDEQLDIDSTLPKVADNALVNMQRCIKKLPSWRAVVRKMYKADEWRRDLQAMRTRVTTDDVKDINVTEPAMKAISLLHQANKRELNSPEYCLVRDFILASIGLQNCQRPGAMEGLTMGDFNCAEFDDETNTYTIYAPQHKRSTAGPAPLTMTVSLYNKLATFVTDVRSTLDVESEKLFLTQEGKEFSEGTIGRRITNFWKKTGVRPDINMTSTKVRQMGTNTTLKNSDQHKRLVHRHMTHCEPIANRFYFKPDTKTIAGKGHKILKDNIGYNDSEDNREEGEDQGLSEEDKELLLVMFEDEVSANAKLTIQDVEERISSSSGLLHLMASGKTLKQAINHLRYQQRKSAKTTLSIIKKKQAKTLDRRNKWLVQTTDVKSLGSHSRTQWEQADTEGLEEFYANFKVCPDKSQILAHMESNRLKSILDKEGFARCYQKVKNIFKKKRS